MASKNSDHANAGPQRRVADLAGLFLRLGLTAFGGPAAHLAMMHEQVVARRGWLTDAEFLDLLSAANLIPGPGSTEMAIHIGFRRARWLGLLVAGTCFILPAAILVTALAAIYQKYGSLPQTAAVLYGIKPVVIAIVIHAVLKLTRIACKTPMLAFAGLAAALLTLGGFNQLGVLFAIAAVYLVMTDRRIRLFGAGVLHPLLAAAPSAPVAISLMAIFLSFAKIGAVLFGGGYVLFAFLQREIVDQRHWLTSAQLLDAIAAGQITPGPLFTSATFVGYLIAGPPGALVATLGIFLPAFVFVALTAPVVPLLRRSAALGHFVDGLNAASVGLMAAVTWQLGRAAIVDWITMTVAITTMLILLRWRINPVWLVLAGGTLGLAIGYR